MKKTLIIERRAHVYIQKPNKEIKSLLIVIHGYGQRAEDFIKEFDYLKKTNTLVVAPEGISKYYNSKREAVASWMTAHERLDEIADYCSYLNKVLLYLNQEYSFSKFGVLGFSQGVSTVCRWIAASHFKKAKLYLCAGSIPPELEAKDFENQKELKVNYYYGDEDRLLSIANAKRQIAVLYRLKIDFDSYLYNGRHKVAELCHNHIATQMNNY